MHIKITLVLNTEDVDMIPKDELGSVLASIVNTARYGEPKVVENKIIVHHKCDSGMIVSHYTGQSLGVWSAEEIDINK